MILLADSEITYSSSFCAKSMWSPEVVCVSQDSGTFIRYVVFLTIVTKRPSNPTLYSL